MDQPLNMDLSKTVVIDTFSEPWVGSRAEKVVRKPLEREKAESGRATSIVEFSPGASFPKHVHYNGEEILVLDGVFSDEIGDYPAGTYLRNPPGSSHAPKCDKGCRIFVKLEQFNPLDTQQVVKNIVFDDADKNSGSIKVMPLHQYESETTELIFWPSGQKFDLPRSDQGEEILVIKGVLSDDDESYSEGFWIRRPVSGLKNFCVEEDAILFVKTGHLRG